MRLQLVLAFSTSLFAQPESTDLTTKFNLAVMGLRSKDRKENQKAEFILKELGPKAIPLLVEKLGDRDPELWLNTARALAVFKDAPIPFLEGLLRGKDRRKREGAAMALSWMGRVADIKAASPALIDALRIDSNEDTRELIIEAIAATRDPRVVQPLVDFAQSRADVRNRTQAVMALGHVGGVAPKAILALVSMHNSVPEAQIDDDWGEWIRVALANIGQSVIPAVAENLRNEKRGERRRLAYLDILRRIDPEVGIQPATPVLIDLLEDRNSAIRTESASVLGSIGSDAAAAVGPLLKFISKEQGVAKLEGALALWRVDGSGAMDSFALGILCDGVSSKALTERKHALKLLSAMGKGANKAVPQVAGALHDKDATVRWLACRALGHIGGSAKLAVPALKRIEQSDPDKEVRSEARSAIETLTEK